MININTENIRLEGKDKKYGNEVQKDEKKVLGLTYVGQFYRKEGNVTSLLVSQGLCVLTLYNFTRRI